MSHPLAVVTPSFNYAGFLPTAIDSVRRASSHPIQHAVWDGQSTDDTVAFLETTGADVVWKSGPDAGQSDALNRALRMVGVGTKYIGWLNADDFYIPGAADVAVAYLEANPDVDVVHGDTVLVDADGNFLEMLFGYSAPYSILASRGCVIASTTCFFRRDMLNTDPWDVRLKMLMDWDLFLTAMEQGHRFAHIPEVLGGMRIHPGQVTAGHHGRSTPEHQLVRSKHGLQLRGKPPIRLAADVAHKVVKTGQLRRQGRRQPAGLDAAILDSDGLVSDTGVADLRSALRLASIP